MRPAIVVLVATAAGLLIYRDTSSTPPVGAASPVAAQSAATRESPAEVALDTPFGEDLAGCPMDTVFRHDDPTWLVEEFVRRDAEGPRDREDLARAWEAGAVTCVERTTSDDFAIITSFDVSSLGRSGDTARYAVTRVRAFNVRFDPKLALRRLYDDSASVTDTVVAVHAAYGWRIDALRAGIHRFPGRALTELSLRPVDRARLERLVASTPSNDTIRVLVYNIHAGKDASGADNLARVAAVVRDAGADLVLLQEVDRGTRRSGGVDQVAMLEQLTGMHGAFGNTLDYDGGEYGIALLSRWPIMSDTLVRLRVRPPQERAGGSYEPRGALHARVASPSGNLTVITTHLDPSGNDHWRLQEVRGVLDVASGAGERSMVLVGGDFNSTPESATQQTIRRRGLRDAFGECGTGPGLTYPADSGTKRIDYLFLTGDARCASAKVLPTTASDHRPLLVEMLLPRMN